MTFEYLRQSLFFYRNHIGMIARIQLPFLLLVSVLGQLNTGGDISTPEARQALAMTMLANVLLMPIYQGATIAYLGSVVANQPISAGQALATALSRWRSLFMVYLLTAVAISTGFMLLIIPGVYVMVRLFFADYICIVENKSCMDAIKASWKDARLYFWPLLNGLAPLALFLLVLQIALGELLPLDNPDNALLTIPVEVLSGLLGSALSVYGFRIYCVMKEERGSEPDQT